MSKKIVNLDKLQKYCQEQKQAGEKIVLTQASFDLLQLSFIYHLQEAKSKGDILIVVLAPPPQSQRMKGGKEYSSAQTGAEIIAALECVDKVSICPGINLEKLIDSLQPDFFACELSFSRFLNSDTDKFINTLRTGNHEVKLVETKPAKNKVEHTSPYIELLPAESKAYLGHLKKQYDISFFRELLEKMKKKKVLIIGEAIIDEYQFCKTINKANKEPILAVKMLYGEKYAGGSMAIANHLSEFCGEVGLLTCLGKETSSRSFIEKNLSSKIKRHFMLRDNSPTIVKRRFVEEYLSQKLFETYLMENELLNKKEEQQLIRKINKILPDYDLVIVADYGHGMMTSEVISAVIKKANFLAVNAQTNAGNRGFNYISKYPKSDYISIDDPEARQEVRDQNSPMEKIMEKITSQIDCPRFTVTRGKLGCSLLDRKEGMVNVPAFAVKMIDRIGAGDAFLAFSSCFTEMGCKAEIAGFIGNIAGAEACATIGNKESITPDSMLAHIASLIN